MTSEKPIELDLKQVPHHIAIIMDGNRRWAQSCGLSPSLGHEKGVRALSNIVEKALSLGVKVLTVYTFSTENWNRDQEEIDSLMKLLERELLFQKNRMIKNGIRLETIGDLSKLPFKVRMLFNYVKKATADGKNLDLVVAINYGSRDNIRRAITSIVKDCLDQKITQEEITETLISSYLDTSPWENPDLLIRTSGEMRLSNFLLWEISYTEVYITDTLWPNFDEQDLIKAINVYQKRRRGVGC